MGVTLATHNGSLVRREHNVRNPKVVAKEEHIDMNGVHEIWHDEKIREAYDRIFGDAVEKYNERQKRADRKISNYYNEIEKHAKKHVAYEMIVGVYSDKKSGYLDEEMQHDILKEFVDGWSEKWKKKFINVFQICYLMRMMYIINFIVKVSWKN